MSKIIKPQPDGSFSADQGPSALTPVRERAMMCLQIITSVPPHNMSDELRDACGHFISSWIYNVNEPQDEAFKFVPRANGHVPTSETVPAIEEMPFV
jgi:hypothetical protein